MSKIGNYYIELTEQANELGFETVEEALENGYEIERGELKQAKDEQTKAHEAWLKERDEVIKGLQLTLIKMSSERKNETKEYDDISRALKFIEEGEC